MRILDFFDGFSSSTAPILELVTAGRLSTHANDAAYETAKGSAAAEGDFYFNTTDKVVRVYDGTQWKSVGGLTAKQEKPTGLINGINTVFTVTLQPIASDALLVFKDSILVPSDEYVFSAPSTITFNIAPSNGQSIDVFYITEGNPATAVVIGSLEVEYKDLSAGDIVAKEVTLSGTPIEPAKVVLDIVGGTPQRFSTDYTVSGNILSWNGLDLDGLLTAGDQLRILYIV